MSEKIVIVDDSEIVREMVIGLLEESGYEVLGLDSPFALSQVLQTARPSMVLVDVNMPGLRGDKLVQIVGRHNLHKCPIVLYSDLPAADLSSISQEVGASGYIQKSLVGDDLVAAVRKYLSTPEQ